MRMALPSEEPSGENIRKELPASHHTRKRKILFGLTSLVIASSLLLLVWYIGTTTGAAAEPKSAAAGVVRESQLLTFDPFAPIFHLFGMAWGFVCALAGWAMDIFWSIVGFLSWIFLGIGHCLVRGAVDLWHAILWIWNGLCYGISYVFHGIGHFFEWLGGGGHHASGSSAPAPAPSPAPKHTEKHHEEKPMLLSSSPSWIMAPLVFMAALGCCCGPHAHCAFWWPAGLIPCGFSCH
mmetsp:Transcript_33156/g.64101  ORF Transcript_33156/g.64101 Transcript_33156/m.64101 type:complete len:237 (-) Transcript_33156:250-960(-)